MVTPDTPFSPAAVYLLLQDLCQIRGAASRNAGSCGRGAASYPNVQTLVRLAGCGILCFNCLCFIALMDSPQDRPSLETLTTQAHRLLLRSKLTVAVAESCTGGLLGAALSSLPGSSAYFLGGVLSYADSVKTHLLGVDEAVIRENGAVSAPVALLMARGVVAAVEAHIGISITGVAGPGGGTEQKPAGTTYIAIIGPGIERVEQYCWHGDRGENRQQSVKAALILLIAYLEHRQSRWSPPPDPGSRV